MILYQKGSENDIITSEQLNEIVISSLDKLGKQKKVLAIPPDITRYHSRAGEITCIAKKYYGEKLTDIMPAIGTHFPMTKDEIKKMFPSIPLSLFREHDWRNGTTCLGRVPPEFVSNVSNGLVNFDWPADVDKLLINGKFDLILSIGQVVPHEVIGMANGNKNIFVGTGGAEGINKSHFVGAVYGMEKIMGRADTPVRRILNYASEHFASSLPIVYIQTVIGKDNNGKLVMRGIFIGDDNECFEKAAALSLKVNFTMLDEPLKKVVVYLDPAEFKSTWLGNKSIYRTRMAIADGGELIVLAPGLREFGEDKTIDKLIRKYGYVGAQRVKELVEKNEDLKNNLSAAAHLIHGSSEGRFTVTYCPGYISREEIEKANFKYGDLAKYSKKYDTSKLKDGFNEIYGEKIFYISNPAIGLWAYRKRFLDK